jgi:DNA-binding SARP family transcriptional activator
MDIRVYLTGRIGIEAQEELVVEDRHFRGKQGRLAFVCLVSERSRPVPREELAKIIWAEDLAESWELSLSSLISRLRGLLACDALAVRGVSLSSRFGQYELRLPADTWVDVESCGTAVDRAEGALRRDEPQRILGPATVAVNISRRPFLPGIEGEWVDSQRRRLERVRFRALDCLSKMWLAKGQAQLAVETATEAIELDPYRESSYQLLMRAHILGGNRANAFYVYHRLRKLLDIELGTGPSAETETMYRDLLK